MAAKTSPVRYSTSQVSSSDQAKSFPWEQPIPLNPFWDTFSYSTARSFLSNFTPLELANLPLDPSSPDSHPAKLHLLLCLLTDKLAREEEQAAAAAGSTPPTQALFQTDYSRWFNLQQGISQLQSQLALPEAEHTLRMLVARAPPEADDVRPQHMLAAYLVTVGQYKEAEALERVVCAWMDGREGLGPGSPQALSARRTLARALWGQGEERRAEAEGVVSEVEGLVEGMGRGRFGVYQEEERRLNREMVAALVDGE